MENDVSGALDRIPLFDGVDRAAITTERLGGLTNRNYRIESPVGHYVLRLAGEGTGEYIDRAAEELNARIASDAGVNAELIYFNAADGTMLCRYVEQAVTMDIERFRDLDAVARAGVAFRKLHECGRAFKGQFELFEQIDQYLEVVRKLGAKVPDGYDEVHRGAESVRNALAAHALPSAPCHCDPMVENCLDTGSVMFIIDFEYSGTKRSNVGFGRLVGGRQLHGRTGSHPVVCVLLGRTRRLRLGSNGHVQGHVRSALDLVGCRAACQQQPCRRFLGVRSRPTRALQGIDQQRWFSDSSQSSRTRPIGGGDFVAVTAKFLDEQQYTQDSIRTYESVYGKNFVSPGGRQTATELISRLQLNSGQHVLDVGCGLGGSAFLMATMFDARVDGIDLSHNMIELARTRLLELRRDARVRLAHGDCLTLERTDAYDAVYSRDVFLHIHDKRRLFAVLNKVLRAGGRLLFTDYCCSAQPWTAAFSDYVEQRGYSLHTIDEYADIIRRAGFKDVQAHDRTQEFIDILYRDLDRIRNGPLDERHRFPVESSWQKKLERALHGEQRWGLFEATK